MQFFRALLLVALAAFARGGSARAGEAVELVYVYEAGCPYCRLWDERLGPIYPRSAEGARAPLRRIEKSEVARSALKLERPLRYTPTFVLVLGDREVGRIEGYPGEDFFWPRLDRLLDRLPSESGTAGKTDTR